jgi:cell wall-associated NlpC family hydrolase
MKKRIMTAFIVFAAVLTLFATTAFADYYTQYRTLYYGIQSTDVANLQQDLRSLGYFASQPTGYFGIMTKQAVLGYQASKNMKADGIVGHITARAIKVDRVIQTGKSYLGVPYVWGGTTPAGFDCSGFTQYVMAKNGITIPRTAALQYEKGTPVDKSSLVPGDMVFFTTYQPGASHVGIYIGGDQFMHASSGAGKIIISQLSNTYYAQHYIGARRVI